jgi:Arc/MetJ-type ribon-helix-helix transcriptional regulator
MVYNYGMSVMNKRATFALDEETIQSIKKLSSLMHVSQAEVVRRAVALAEKIADGEAAEKINRVKAYHQQGGISAEKAEEYLGEVRKNRSSWGRGW